MIVLIPAYEPDNKLLDLIRQLGHRQIVVVDDGSGPGHATVFAQARVLGADVITLDRNRGKGRALKTGFAYIRATYPGQNVVCADSDGQHTFADIEAVARRLSVTGSSIVLGARHFTGRVPIRSKLGNAVTRTAYALVTGQTLVDTQTGLRGYPASMLGWLCETSGERYEYELRLLLRAARGQLRIEEVDIATIYVGNNASSHFRPLVDSARVYRPLLAFALSSLLAFAIDTTVLLVLAALTGSVARSAIVARVISATVNYGVNRVWVFSGDGMTGHTGRKALAPRATSASRYAALALGLFVVNVTTLKLLTIAGGLLIVAKAFTELVLFVISYVVQKRLVFARPAERQAEAVRVSSGQRG